MFLSRKNNKSRSNLQYKIKRKEINIEFKLKLPMLETWEKLCIMFPSYENS